MLRAVKPFLNAVNAMGVFALPKRGVCVMTSEDSAYTLQTAHGADMEGCTRTRSILRAF